MKTLKFACCLWLLFPVAGIAACIRPHSMAEYTASVQDVVLCDEEKVEIKKIERHSLKPSQDWTAIQTLVTCKVTRVFKGDLELGATLQANYDMVFYRTFYDHGRFTDLDSNAVGRALLFLTKEADQSGYRVVTAKLIQNGTVYQFDQATCPGPLILFPQYPENFTGPQGDKILRPETEEDLIKDEMLAVEKAATIKPLALP